MNLPTVNQLLRKNFIGYKELDIGSERVLMAEMVMTSKNVMDISYGIYTIERLPKGSKRTPKWGLHSTANDKETAEMHAKTLSAQPYFDYIEIQEFRTCPETHKRTVHKIKSYSRKNPIAKIAIGLIALTLITLLILS